MSEVPPLSQAQQWSTEHLTQAADQWEDAADTLEWVPHQVWQHAASLNGSGWFNTQLLGRTQGDAELGAGKAELLRTAAQVARRGATLIDDAKRSLLYAVGDARDDGFDIADDYTATDTQDSDDEDEQQDRQEQAVAITQDLRAKAARLAEADHRVTTDLARAATGIGDTRFHESGDTIVGDHKNHAGLVDYHTEQHPPTPGNPKPEPGHTAPQSGQPPNVLDALTAAAQGKPDPNDKRYTHSPLTDPLVAADPSVVARQAGKVADARRALDDAQAKLDAAAKQAYTQGPGSGTDRTVTNPLSQAVFDARRNLTEQSAILDDLNKSAATTGAARPIPTPPLPPNAGVQAFPAEPTVAAQAIHGLTDASHDINKTTFGLVPDVAKDIHTFSNWGAASPGDRTDAILDSASLIPGGKLLGEVHHGLDALAGAARHADDIPTPHVDVPTPHTDVPAPVEHHVDGPAADHDLLGGHAVPSSHDAPQPVEGHDYGFSPQRAFELSPNPADEIARLEAGGVPSHVTDGYDPFAGRTIDQYKQEFTVPGHDGLPRWDWDGQAPHNGFAGTPAVTDRIPQGHLLDRLGSEGGAFMADDGAPLSTRSMPPGVASQYHQYVGTGEPIPPDLNAEVRYGPAKQAFGQPGGATQWVVVDKSTGQEIPVQILRQRGVVDAIRPPGS